MGHHSHLSFGCGQSNECKVDLCTVGSFQGSKRLDQGLRTHFSQKKTLKEAAKQGKWREWLRERSCGLGKFLRTRQRCRRGCIWVMGLKFPTPALEFHPISGKSIIQFLEAENRFFTLAFCSVINFAKDHGLKILNNTGNTKYILNTQVASILTFDVIWRGKHDLYHQQESQNFFKYFYLPKRTYEMLNTLGNQNKILLHF